MLSFNQDKDIAVSSQTVNWKNDKLNLCQKYPRLTTEDDNMGDLPDQGSFFNFFESNDDELDVSTACGVLTQAVTYPVVRCTFCWRNICESNHVLQGRSRRESGSVHAN
jgi:hypothetical protein